MSVGYVFKRLADLLYAGKERNRFISKKPLPPWQTGASRAASRRREAAETVLPKPQSFDEQISSLANAKKNILAGSLELIGLGEIKAGLGDEWPLFADHVVHLAEQEIRRSLDPLDSFRRHGDLNFLVHFGHLDKEKAQRKAKETTDRIKATLINKVPAIAGVIRVRTFVGEVDGGTLDASATLADALFARLVQMRVEVVDDLKARRMSLASAIRVRFSPVWRSGKELTILSRCIIDRDYYRDLSLRLYELDDQVENGSVSAEIDYLTLTKSLESLHQLRLSGGVAVLLIPFEVSTICSPSSQEEYLRLLKTIPESYRKFIVLEAHGIADHLNLDECLCQIAIIRPLVKSLVVTFALGDTRVVQLAESDIWAISVDLADHPSPDRQIILDLSRFITLCRGKETLLMNANTLGLVRTGIESGVTYVEGTAVHLPTREPRQTQRARFSPIG